MGVLDRGDQLAQVVLHLLGRARRPVERAILLELSYGHGTTVASRADGPHLASQRRAPRHAGDTRVPSLARWPRARSSPAGQAAWAPPSRPPSSTPAGASSFRSS